MKNPDDLNGGADPLEQFLLSLAAARPELAFELMESAPESVQRLLDEYVATMEAAPDEEAAGARMLARLHAMSRTRPASLPARLTNYLKDLARPLQGLREQGAAFVRDLESLGEWAVSSLRPIASARIGGGAHFALGGECPEILYYPPASDSPARKLGASQARLELKPGGEISIKLQMPPSEPAVHEALTRGTALIEALDKVSGQSLFHVWPKVEVEPLGVGPGEVVALSFDLTAVGMQTQALGRIDPHAVRLHLFALDPDQI